MRRKQNHSVNETESSLEAILIGLAKSYPHKRKLLIAGEEFTPEEYATKARACLAPYTDAREAHNLLSERVQLRDEAHPDVARFVENSVRYFQGFFGADNPKLRDFGIEPKRGRRQLTGEELAARTEKARATRAKNGTLGKRRRSSGGSTPPAPPRSAP